MGNPVTSDVSSSSISITNRISNLEEANYVKQVYEEITGETSGTVTEYTNLSIADYDWVDEEDNALVFEIEAGGNITNKRVFTSAGATVKTAINPLTGDYVLTGVPTASRYGISWHLRGSAIDFGNAQIAQSLLLSSFTSPSPLIRDGTKIKSIYNEDDLEIDGGIRQVSGIFEYRRPQGTHGGTYTTANTWQRRDLNTVVAEFDPNHDIFMNTNQISLTKGKWYIKASAVGFELGNHKIRFVKVSSGDPVVLYGNNAVSQGTNIPTYSELEGEIDIDISSQVFELQHIGAFAKVTVGFGQAGNFTGIEEVYSRVVIKKISK